MADIAEIGFRADTSQLIDAKARLDALGPAAGAAETATGKFGRMLDSVTSAAATLNKAASSLTMASERLTLSMGKGQTVAAAAASADTNAASAKVKLASDTDKVTKAVDAQTEAVKRSIKIGTPGGAVQAGTGSFFGAQIPRQKSTQSVFSDVVPGLKAITPEAEKAGEAIAKVGTISSTTTRELLTMAREASMGNFTRLAGSATILAQSLDLMKYLLDPLVLGFAAVGAAVVITARAIDAATVAANQYNNTIQLTGNYANLSGAAVTTMAINIAKVTDTSVSSNEVLIKSLVDSGKFTGEQIEQLVKSADLLSHATGKSAEDVLKSFEKMADGPGKYADALVQQYAGVLQPEQVAHIHLLEDTGHAQEALTYLIKAQTLGIVISTEDAASRMGKAWRDIKNSMSDYFSGLSKNLADHPFKTIANSFSTAFGGGDMFDLSTPVVKQTAEQKALSDAQAANTAKVKEQGEAYAWLNGNVGKSYDSISKFKADVQQLDAYLAKADHNNPRIKEMLANRAAIVEGLRQQDMPATYKRENTKPKHVRTPSTALSGFDVVDNSADKDLATLKAQSDGLTMTAEAAATLTEKTKLMNEAESKGLTLSASQIKTINDKADAFGKLTAQIDLAKIAQSGQDDVSNLDDQASKIGLVGKALAYETEMTKLLTNAKKQKLIVDSNQAEIFDGIATEFANKSVANDNVKYYEDATKAANENIDTLNAEAAAIGMSDEAASSYLYTQKLINDEKYRGIQLTPEEIANLVALNDQQYKLTQRINESKDALNFEKDAAKGFLSDLQSGLQQGEGFFKSFTNAVTNLLDKVLNKLEDVALNAAFGGGGSGVGGFLGNILKSFGIGGSTDGMGSGALSGGQFGSGGLGAFGFNPVINNAKGNAFGSNGIVTSPTLFKFAKGAALGQMGEAGPEAVVPLARGPNGALGIQAMGKGSNDNTTPNVTVNNHYTIAGAVSSAEVGAAIRQNGEHVAQQLRRDIPNIIHEYQQNGTS